MKKGWLITSLLTLVLAGAGIGGTMSYGSDDTLPKGLSVGGLQIGEIAPDTALKQIQERIAQLESTLVNIEPDSLGDVSSETMKQIPSLSLKQLGLKVEAVEAISAIEQYRDYTWLERAEIRYRNSFDSAYGVNVSWDETALKQRVSEAWGNLVSGRSENAARTIDDQDRVIYTEDKRGRQLDVQNLIEQVRELKPASLAGASGQPLLLQASVKETSPEITLAGLKEEGIVRKIAEFTTSFETSGEGRSHNVTVAAKALNDTLLMPGEIFEYGKIVAKAEKEYGYQEAPVILKGKLTPGVGGGICQVSSTLYNAALLTGLDIVERRNHSLVVHYLPKGLDATFASGYVNFKFRNSTGKQLLIRTVVKDKTVTVKLFGTMPDNVSYKTETKQLKVNPPKTVYVADSNVALGKQNILQKGDSGYVVEAYLVKLVDGVFAERKKLSTDTYRTQDTLIAVHPGDPRLLPEGRINSSDPGAKPQESEPPVLVEDESIVEPI
ncbi:VanW family protein [Cohnella mopanensis]|uniref:VanW family protein n=1 Tax=Cohnella mopanensis TaxID=2911966 RepID=UPI001EF87C09|nr:VanW family protein [Cohnella mopanensis]